MRTITFKQIEKKAQNRIALILRKTIHFSLLHRLMPKNQLQVLVALVGLKKMSQLNFQFRGKDTPTDILSFPTSEPFFSQGNIGELIICFPILVQQAQGLKHSIFEELDVLLIHGFLHLLGFDHEKDLQEAKKMARWEKKLLQSLRRKNQGLIQRGLSVNE